VVMGRVPVLECPLLGTHGCKRLCPIISGIKWPHSSRSPTIGVICPLLGTPWRGYRGPRRVLNRVLRRNQWADRW
jgi:hypothetical protein